MISSNSTTRATQTAVLVGILQDLFCMQETEKRRKKITMTPTMSLAFKSPKTTSLDILNPISTQLVSSSITPPSSSTLASNSTPPSSSTLASTNNRLSLRMESSPMTKTRVLLETDSTPTSQKRMSDEASNEIPDKTE